MNPDHYSEFQQTYQEAKIRFRQLVQALESGFLGVQKDSYPVASTSEESLEIDLCFLPSEKFHKEAGSKKLLILTSGVHGVEASTGGALQRIFLEKLCQGSAGVKIDGDQDLKWDQKFIDELRAEVSILIIHPLNPWGYHFNRRVTENNVDLNRNFSLNEELYQSRSDRDSQLNTLLNPEECVKLGPWDELKRISSVIQHLGTKGRKVFRQAIVGGQYEFSKGLFYGGSAPEVHVEIFRKILQKYVSPFSEVLHIDLHTGHGERGKLHLLSGSHLNSESEKRFKKVFQGLSLSSLDLEDFYRVKGEFTQFTVDFFPEKVILPMTFEFGTQNSHTLRGSYFSLKTLILENQAFQHGTGSKLAADLVRRNWNALFRPEEPEWVRQVLRQFEACMYRSLVNFMSEDKV